MEIQLPLLLLPVAISAAGGAALHIGGKSPPLQSCWTDLHGLFIFHMLMQQRDGQDGADERC